MFNTQNIYIYIIYTHKYIHSFNHSTHSLRFLLTIRILLQTGEDVGDQSINYIKPKKRKIPYCLIVKPQIQLRNHSEDKETLV